MFYIIFLKYTKIGGIDRKNIIPINKLGVTNKNFDFIFCDFIKHPIASIINDNISKLTNTIKVILKAINRVDETIFSKLLK